MDARHFDALTQAFNAIRSRRGLIAALGVIPVLGGLLGILTPDEVEGRERRRRRKRRHQRRHHPGKHKGKRKKRCRPESAAQTCAGKCGEVLNRCRKTVECGSCACTPNCGVCLTCQTGVNAPGTCVPDPARRGQACGAAGETCLADGSCGCAATVCAAVCTDLQTDAANCGACGHACTGAQVCQGGLCGVTCGHDFCPAATEICVDSACESCDVCASGCDHATVQAAIDAATSGDTLYLCAGRLVRQGTNRVANIAGKDVILIGAGTGEEGTILDGGNANTTETIASVFQSTSELRQLQVRGARRTSGMVISAPGFLTLTDVLVTDNDAGNFSGGGIANNDRLVLNAGTRIIGNTAFSGGGIQNNDGAVVTLNAGSIVTDNFATLTEFSGIRNSGTVVANPGSVVEGCGNVSSGTGCPP